MAEAQIGLSMTAIPSASLGNPHQAKALVHAMCTGLQNDRCFHTPSSVSRRKALRLISCTVVAPALSGCDRIAPFVVSEATVEQLGLETWSIATLQMATAPPSPDRKPARSMRR